MSRTPEPTDHLKGLTAERREVLIRRLRERAARHPQAASIPRRPGGAPAALSFAQQRLWFLDRLAPGAPTYHMARAVRLRGRLDLGAFQRALDQIVGRHEILRTTFFETAAGPVQVVAPTAGLAARVVDLGTPDGGWSEAEIVRRASEESRRPFDLAHGPPARVALLRLGEDDHVFVLTMHHLVGDGWSFALLDRELAALYEAFSQDRPPSLPEPSIQYADYAHWQRRWGQGDEPPRLLEFWRRQLLGAPPALILPHDRPRPRVPSYRGGRVPFVVGADRTSRLKEMARRRGVTIFMVALSGLQALLHRLSGQNDVCIGAPVAGRTRLETEPLVGCFVNTLVLRGNLAGDPTLAELLGRARATVGDCLAHQELPFEMLVEHLRPERDLSLHPLFQVMLVLQEGVPAEPVLAGLEAHPVDLEIGATPFDLTLILAEQQGGLEGVLEYSVDLFDAATARRMARSFERLLGAMIDDPSRRVSEVVLPEIPMTPAEIHGPDQATRRPPPAPKAAPRDDTERTLERIWIALLGGERFGVHDNFFEAGGHSLLVLQLVSRAREALGVALPVRLVFERPTIAGLAEAIDAERSGGAAGREERIEAAVRAGSAPVSSAQRRLWFIDQLHPGSAAYNIPLAFRLRGPLDRGALQDSLSAIVERHESLRTVFGLADGEPVQDVRPAGLSGMALTDLVPLPPGLRQSEAERLTAEEARAPFDLARGPLFRARLLRLGAEDHVLLLTMHHIVSDGWSLGVLLSELQTLYESVIAGKPTLLPPLPIQYADYAAWERAGPTGDRLNGPIAYWKKQLASAPASLDLPLDRPRPRIATFRGAWRPFRLAPDLSVAIRDLSLREGATLFMTLLAALQALLARYGGQDDLCIGAPVAGRPRVETEGLIGHFINTLVLRADLSGDPTFRELLHRARETVMDAQTYQDLPFERLVDLLSLPRDPARQPLFQVALVLQNLPIPVLRLPALSVESLDVDTGTAKFDLTMQIEETASGIAGSVEYSTDLFDISTIDRLLGHFTTLLEGAVADPERRVSELPLLTPRERRELMAAGVGGPPAEWGGVALPASSGDGREGALIAIAAEPGPGGASCLHEMFEMRARLDPAAAAITFEGVTLSYGELDAAADRLARTLRGRGVRPESMVGVCLDRSPDMIVAILGILKAGGAYVPLDPAYPRERLATILEDTRAPVVLTSERLRDRLPVDSSGHGAEAICLDGRDAAPDREVAERIRTGAFPDHPAYVIYTSGSTGRPKGVVVTHRNVARLFEATRPVLDFGRNDVWTLFHSCAFDFSVWEMWGALLHGGRLVIVPFPVSRSPEAFLDLLRRERVTVLNQTPSAFRALMHAAIGAGTPADLSLRLLVFGGEALEPSSLRPWFERHGDERPILVNMYGITETTVHVTWRRLRAGDGTGRASPIGRALPDLYLHVLDAAGEPVPYGVVGEIYVGGPGLARGYLDRPDLTAERFVADPFAVSGQPGRRLYRTGDLARRRSGGDLEYLGRADDQVKIRGFRIEPGEIEATLALCPGVRQAVVVARPEPDGQERLVAYVVPETGALRTLDVVRGFLMERLPAYMVPSTVMFLETLPTSPGGKVDRRALPAPDRARPDLVESFAAPRTPAERALAEIWAEVLGLERVGIDDNFFALGGDSIRSIQVRARAKDKGLDLSLEQIFAYQTVRGLAAELGRALPADPPLERPGPFDLVSKDDRDRLPADLEDAYPLSRLQQGFVFHSEFSRDYIIYVSSIEVGAPFLADHLRQAVRRLVERQPILRTSFDLNGFGEPLQLVHRHAEIPIEVLDLTALPPARQDAALAAWVEQEMRRRFDWTRRPLLRIHVHRLGEARFQLTVSEPFFDGWSVATLMTDLLAVYSALLRGEDPPPEPPLRSSYRDFVALERDTLRSEACRDFWAGKVQDATACRVPRLERVSRDAEPLPIGRVEVPISPEISGALQRMAWSSGVPLKSLLLAAHVKVVGLATGRKDVVTGLIANGRPEEADGERILGIFLNTLPLRLRLAGGSWTGLARRAFEAEREMLPYRRFPMSELMRATGGQFLSDTAFNYTSFHVYRKLERKGGLDLWGGYGFEQTYFALTAQFNLDELTSQIYLALDYRSAELAREQVEEIAGTYGRVLETMARDPEGRHERFSPLDEGDRRRIVDAWNDTARNERLDGCVHELFEAQVERTPDAVAIVEGTRRLTYDDLNRRANQVAHHLVGLGVRPETLVAVCLRRSLDLVVALLGILKAGGAYVPLDPAYPGERVAFMLEDTGAPVLITEVDLLPALPSHGARAVCPERDRDTLAREPSGNPNRGVRPDNLAYVIYTSGSTGRPKGAAIEHGSTVSLLHWARRALGDDALAGVLASSSVCFDSSVLEIFAPLAWGGAIILAENALRLPALAARHLVRLVNTVPSAIAELVRTDGLPASVRTVSLAGEALQNSLVQKIYAQTTVEGVVNLYGLSEATVYTTIARPQRGATDATPIGRPIDNTRVYVLDEDLEPVSPGVPGEICVGGIGPGRGYVNRPELTAERFVPDPLWGRPGARMYRTGDLGRFRIDGTLDFLGRLDQQVKIRGFRIEPGEIETVLSGHAAIAEAVVQVRDERDGERRLVAYVVAKQSTTSLSLGELRRFLSGRLPEYMVPSVFVVLEALPRTPNGKLDRKALPAPGSSRLSIDETHVAPVTPAEKKLARLWGQILRIERVGLNDNFFEAGGHSLLATQLVSRVREAFQVDLPLRALFDAPTVAGLGRAIEAARSNGGGTVSPALGRRPRTGDPPLSFAQQRLWFLDQLEPGCAFYNVPAVLRVRGRLDVGALRDSLREIVRRHEALRTRFETRRGEPVQVIAEAFEPALPVVDLGRRPADQREAELTRLAREEARAAFDLARGPLLRATLARLSDDDHALLLTMHHAVSDGWSMQLLRRELAQIYDASRGGRVSPLGELVIQYADFATWQREWLQGDVLGGQIEYWKKRLDGAPFVLDLPADRPRPPVQTYRGARYAFALPADLGAALADLSRREGVTLFMTLLAGFEALLFRYTGQEGILVGSPIAGRSRVETEELIGFFVNTLVLRGDLSGDPSFRTLLARTREDALGAYAHQDLPFEKLVEALQPERDLSRAPLFQVMFALQPPSGEVPEPAGLDIECLEVDAGTSQFDLTLSIAEDAEGLAGAFEYSTELFEEATIARMAGHLESLLRSAAADPDRRLSRLPLLSPPERRALLVEWSGAAANRSQGRTVVDLFEAQVARSPGAPAVVSGDRPITYSELDARSTRLARHLRSLGVGPEVPVAICLERSADLIVGILGILRAGGAYVPLDPTYPRERLELMIQDARAPVLLSRERLHESLHLGAPQVVCLDATADAASIATQNAAPLRERPAPDALAYVIYTSGSTGRPKGVQVAHASLAHSTAARIEIYGETPARFLLLSSVAFDSSVAGIFWTLCTGGTLVLPPENVHEDPERLLSVIARQEATHWLSVPSLYAYILAQAREGDLQPLRVVIVAGETCPAALAARHRESVPGAELYNEYGPTEATVWSTVHRCVAPAPGAEARGVPIGRPIRGTRVYLLGPDMEPVPAGVPGELYVGGDGVARGYLGLPASTADVFRPDPWSGEPGARLYRTGDRGRFMSDGTIEFLGRTDHQVKVRGYRIEPEEIEAVLGRHMYIRKSAVVVHEPAPGDARLVAFVVPEPGEVVIADDLRAFLKQKLPQHMVPSAIVPLDALPLTPSGKIDRRALRAMRVDRVPRREGPSTPAPPRDEVERRLVAIWEDLLGVRPIGIDESFFDLGGHSLLGVRAIGRIEADLGQRLPLSILFRGGTIAALAAALRQDTAPDARPPLVWLSGGERATRPPFFFVHPIGGTVFCYAALARLLRDDRRYYALEAPGIHGDAAPASRVEDLADLYLGAIRDRQPRGPYYLGGWSFGGVVAYEIACRLAAAGERLGLLALIDTHVPGSLPAQVDPLDGSTLVGLLARELGDRPGSVSPAGASDDASGGAPLVDRVLERARAGGLLPSEIGRPEMEHLLAVLRANLQALRGYLPGAYPGRVALLRAAEATVRRPDPSLGWNDRAAGGVETHEVPGDHYSMMREPQVRVLAKKLGALLERAANGAPVGVALPGPDERARGDDRRATL